MDKQLRSATNEYAPLPPLKKTPVKNHPPYRKSSPAMVSRERRDETITTFLSHSRVDTTKQRCRGLRHRNTIDGSKSILDPSPASHSTPDPPPSPIATAAGDTPPRAAAATASGDKEELCKGLTAGSGLGTSSGATVHGAVPAPPPAPPGASAAPPARSNSCRFSATKGPKASRSPSPVTPDQGSPATTPGPSSPLSLSPLPLRDMLPLISSPWAAQ